MDSYGAQVLADTPLVYWRLEEGAGNFIDQIGAVPAVPAGGVSYRVPGALGSGDVGASFNGTTGYANAGALAALNFGAGSYTIEAWVKAAGGAYATLVGKSNNVTGWRAFLTPANTLALFWATDSDLYLSSQQVRVTPGQWGHCLWGYDAVAGRAFYAVNGVYEAMAVEPNHPVTSAAAVTLGADARPGYFYTGALDEVAVYASALTPAQITRHYVAGLGAANPKLEIILRNKSGHAILGYDESLDVVTRLAGNAGTIDPTVEPVLWNKSGDPVLGYLEPTDTLVVLAGGGVAPAPGILAPATYAAVIQSHGPTNYWRLDEATGLLARDRVGGADGTISGGVTLNQAGALADGNPALRLNGVDGVVTAAGATTAPAAVSLEVWVKRQGAGGGSAPRIFSSQPSFKLELADGGGNITYYFTFTDASNTGFQVSGIPLPTGVWVHVVLTFDATAVRVYANGALAHTATTWAGKVLASGAGVSVGFAGQTFNGLVDEVALYPRALTAAEVAQHYAAGFGVFQTVEPILRNKSGHAVLGYDETRDQLSVLCKGGL